MNSVCFVLKKKKDTVALVYMPIIMEKLPEDYIAYGFITLYCTNSLKGVLWNRQEHMKQPFIVIFSWLAQLF